MPLVPIRDRSLPSLGAHSGCQDLRIQLRHVAASSDRSEERLHLMADSNSPRSGAVPEASQPCGCGAGRSTRNGSGRRNPFQAIHRSACARGAPGYSRLSRRLRLPCTGRCDPAISVHRAAESDLREPRTRVVAAALVGAVRAVDRVDHPVPARQRRTFARIRVSRPAEDRPPAGSSTASSSLRWPHSASALCSGPKHR